MTNQPLSLLVRKLQSWAGVGGSHQFFTEVLKACAAVSNINLGKSLHGQAIKLGHSSCQLVSKAVLNMYAKCKALDECQEFFSQMSCCDTVSWNIALSGFSASRGYDAEVMRLFYAMHISVEPKPSDVTLAIVLPVCARNGYLGAGRSLHCYTVKCGFESHTLVANALISMYAKGGHILGAYFVFHEIGDKDVVSWNAIIAGFIENESFHDAFQLFRSMLLGPIQPNYATIANVLPVCGSLGETVVYKLGKQIHCYVLQRAELISEITVLNALLSFYLRVGKTKEAESLFQTMKFKDIVSWNSLITGYALNGDWSKAVNLLKDLVNFKLMKPEPVTLISTLPACAQLNDLYLGKQIHGYVIRRSYLQEDTRVMNALISFYAKCGYTKAALKTFQSVSKRDLITWNAVLDACVENRFDGEFFNVLQWMWREGIRPDSITVLMIIQFCGTHSKADLLKAAHAFLVRAGYLVNDDKSNLGNALLDAYAKCGLIVYASKTFESMLGKRNLVTCNSMISGYMNCGSPADAHLVFERMSDKDFTTWNVMIKGYADNACPDQSLRLFQKLQCHGMKPDCMTIMSFLPVCVQMSSVHILRQCHGYVVRSCFEDLHLDGALIDAYSKCGSLGSAYKLFNSTRKRDLIMFTAMIGGYALHGMGIEALKVFYTMIGLGLQPDHVIMTAVLSACSHAGLIEEGLKIFDSIQKVHQIKPNIEQYACVVDLLARGGRLKDAYSFVNQMPIEANATIWGTLLGACKTHNEVELGSVVAKRLLAVKSNDIGNFVVMSNMYAANASWDGVLEIRRLMRVRDLKKPAGRSWIEVEGKETSFIAGECSLPQKCIISRTLRALDRQIKELSEI